jgi:hypothetical protein
MKKILLNLTVGLGLMSMIGCASTGGGGGAASDVSAPAAPAKKAFQPPSFESTEFVSEEYGFRLHYPADFTVEETQAPSGLLTAASPSMVPRLDVNVSPQEGEASLEQAAAAVEAQMAQLGGGEAKVTGSEVITLQDGVTKAMRFDVDWSFQGFPLSSVVVLVANKGSLVNVTVTGMQGGEVADLHAISDTLYID